MTTYEQTIDLGSTGGVTFGEMPSSARPFSLDCAQSDQPVGAYYTTPLNIDYSPGALSGIIGKDQTPPEFDAVNPPAGTITRTTSIEFEVYDNLDELQIVTVSAAYADEVRVIHDGTSFAPGFAVGSTRSVIGSGYAFLVIPDGDGWAGDFTLRAVAVDDDGNTFALARAYVISDPLPPPDTTDPTISNVSPTPGTAIARTAPLTFDVTDAGLGRVLVCAVFAGGGYEVVHDGDSFAAGYATLSTRVAITDGYRFRVRRGAGWTEAPTIRIFAFDVAGNES